MDIETKTNAHGSCTRRLETVILQRHYSYSWVISTEARRDYFEQKAAKSPAQMNCQRLTPTRLLNLKKWRTQVAYFPIQFEVLWPSLKRSWWTTVLIKRKCETPWENLGLCYGQFRSVISRDPVESDTRSEISTLCYKGIRWAGWNSSSNEWPLRRTFWYGSGNCFSHKFWCY